MWEAGWTGTSDGKRVVALVRKMKRLGVAANPCGFFTGWRWKRKAEFSNVAVTLYKQERPPECGSC